VLLRKGNLHGGSIYCVDFCPDSRLIASGSNDKLVKITVLPTEDCERFHDAGEIQLSTMRDDRTEATLSKGFTLEGQGGTVRDVCFTPSREQGSTLLSAGAGDFGCRLWDIGAGPRPPLVTFRGHTACVYACSNGPLPQTAISGGADGCVRMWDFRTGGCTCTIETGGREVLCTRAWPGDPSRYVATSHNDGSCLFWDIRMGMDAEGERVGRAGGGSDSAGKAQGRCVSTMLHHSDETRAMDFSPTGSHLLTASFDGLTTICQCTSGVKKQGHEMEIKRRGPPPRETSHPSLTALATVRAHGGRVLQACWRPKGDPVFLTSSTDCTVMLWALPYSRRGGASRRES
ncbi:unnamed protein product, partial [Discosporangium mesarthrocarpum]